MHIRPSASACITRSAYTARAHTLLCHFSADEIIGDLLDISSTSVYNKQQHVHRPWDTSVVKTLTACSLQCSTIDPMCIHLA